jgi:deoxycytidylate deaminase
MRHQKYINLCIKLAQKSLFYRYKHCSILTKSGKIIAIGFNKNKSGASKNDLYERRKIHAELDVLSKFSLEETKGMILYVGGIRNGEILNSCPCETCQKLIKDYNLKAVYYSNLFGEPEKLVI